MCFYDEWYLWFYYITMEQTLFKQFLLVILYCKWITFSKSGLFLQGRFLLDCIWFNTQILQAISLKVLVALTYAGNPQVIWIYTCISQVNQIICLVEVMERWLQLNNLLDLLLISIMLLGQALCSFLSKKQKETNIFCNSLWKISC